MGAKDWMLVYAEGNAADILRSQPTLDREATRAFVERLHPSAPLTPIDDASLGSESAPDEGTVYAGVFPGLTLILTESAAQYEPSELPQHYIDEARDRTLYLHAMHSTDAWFAYAIWEGGTLRRSLSLSPDDHILENLGEPLAFELPYWAGKRTADEEEDLDIAEFTRFIVIDGPLEDAPPRPFDFNPLDLAEEALRTLFGFAYESEMPANAPDLDRIVLAGYQVG
ncbi:hypothetical protein OG474_10145 [Kribbella sp. NBC_01505]|uniref:DUF6928 family protein n=1 Tax=Kribbella sp. NBC_01505 TaxID=2903580 RepID=UPI00386B8223